MKEKWGTMSFKEKSEYLWTYYKSWLLVPVCLALAAALSITMYHGIHTKVLLNVVIIGGNQQSEEEFSESFCKYAGIQESDGTVRINTNIPDDGSALMQTLITTLIGANAADVIICPEKIYEEYHSQDGFLRVEDVMAEAGIQWQQEEPEDALIVLKTEESPLYKNGMISYNPAYAAMPVNCVNKTMAARFLQYLGQF